MNTIILAENRKLGVDWVTQSIPVDPETEEYRTQTEIIYKNKDRLRVFSRQQQFEAYVASYGSSLKKTDRIMVVGVVDTGFIEKVVLAYKAKGHTVEINQANGQILSATALKRKALIQQMEDLEKEERLQGFFNSLDLPGTKVNRVHIGVNNSNRTFTVTIDGKFT